MPNREIHNPIYRLLIESKFRWCRHVIFIVSVGIVFFNHVYLTYEGQIKTVNIQGIAFAYILVALSIMYFNLYVLIPKLLLKGKYMQYALTILTVICFALAGDIYTEYNVYQFYQIPFGQYSFFNREQYKLLNLFYSFFIFALYIVSITVIVFYKHWLLSRRKLEQLKTEQLRTDLDNLKSQISAEYLLDKLNKSAELCKTRPSKVSLVLLQLSYVLRYQLYDCSRESVLLNSEIKFLNDYLTLEKSCNDHFNFKISHPKTTVNYFVPPLLFISFIEDALTHIAKQDSEIWINVEFNISDNLLTFMCSDNRFICETEENTAKYSSVVKRLKLLSPKEYSLNTEWNKGKNMYKLTFQYEL